jgi:hypothetical protein
MESNVVNRAKRHADFHAGSRPILHLAEVATVRVERAIHLCVQANGNLPCTTGALPSRANDDDLRTSASSAPVKFLRVETLRSGEISALRAFNLAALRFRIDVTLR